jgi:carbon-monoxide dehydrogenase medium subunit
MIHSLQVRTSGTLVGNVCVGTPASDILTALVALNGSLDVAGNGVSYPLESFCTGAKRTVQQQKDLITEIDIPAVPEDTYGAYLNLTRTLPDIAKITLALNLIMDGRRCTSARVAIGAVAPTVVRPTSMEKLLGDSDLTDKIINEAAEAAATDPAVTPISDMRSTADYRREMVKVLVARGLTSIRGAATNGGTGGAS